VDLRADGIGNDAASVLDLVREIATVEIATVEIDDGLIYDAAGTSICEFGRTGEGLGWVRGGGKGSVGCVGA
jgi:hypothetical protein